MLNPKLAQGVKELRKRKFLSQKDLANKSGLALRTIQRVENGETEPSGETLKRLSTILEVAPYELIDWESNKEILKKTVKTKYEYLHIFDNKILLTKTTKINDIVEDYGKSVNNVFKTLMVFFIFIPIFTTLTVIFYNLGKNGLAIYAGAFAFFFLVVAFYTMLFTSGASLIKIENITKIRMQKKLFINVVIISYKESGRLKERSLALEKNQVDTMRDALLAEHLIEGKNIKLKGNKDLISMFLIMALLMSGQFSNLLFKSVDPMMVNGFIILFVSFVLLINMMLRLTNPLHKKMCKKETLGILEKAQ